MPSCHHFKSVLNKSLRLRVRRICNNVRVYEIALCKKVDPRNAIAVVCNVC